MAHRWSSLLGSPRPHCPLLAGLAIATAIVTSVGSTSMAGGGRAATTRTVSFSLVDKAAAPVTDIQAADLEVKEGGKAMEIVSVKPAMATLRIAIVDSDAGS